jgi:polyisoprenoid-binding protein YceI
MQRFAIPLALVALCSAPASFAGTETYRIEKTHADLLFSIDHAGFTQKHGWFRDFDGSLQYDAAKPENSKVEVVVKTDSLDTALPARDKDVKGETFLDTAKYPEMRFVSTKVVPGANQELRIEGNLTLHGVTKPITLNAKLNKAGPNPFDKRPTLGFSATGALKRSDFGMSSYIPVVGDAVTIKLDVEFNRSL